MVLVHRDTPISEVEDPYDPSELSPFLSRALDSSVWELASQTAHFHAPTATLARVFAEPFSKPQYALEDFLDHSYATVSEALRTYAER